MKLTVIDVFIIVLLGLSLFSFSLKYEPKYEFGYSGSQIYRAVEECEKLDSRGFLYTVYARGYWNADVGYFEEEAFVAGTGRGYLVLKLKDGRIVTMGGQMSYKEDIQAVNIEILQKSKSSVHYVLKPFEGSEEDVLKYIEDSAGFINYVEEDMVVSAVLTIDTDTEQSILLESEIEDKLQKEIFFLKSADVEIYDDGFTVAVERLSMKEVDTFFEILGRYFTVTGIYTGDVKVVYQTAEEIKEEDVPLLEAYKGENIYPGSIHVRV